MSDEQHPRGPDRKLISSGAMAKKLIGMFKYDPKTSVDTAAKTIVDAIFAHERMNGVKRPTMAEYKATQSKKDGDKK